MTKRRFVIAGAVVIVAAAGLATLGWRRHARAERLHAAPACAQTTPLGAVCGPCVAAFCCQEITSCYTRTDCIDLNDCTIECGETEKNAKGPACRPRCEARYPMAVATFKAWDDCARRNCESECPRGEDD
jgi:hypothetical protein